MAFEVRELDSDADIIAAFPLMASLRDRLRPDRFLAEVRRQQVEGYRLYGGFDDGRLVTLAGVRRSHTLSRGEFLFVDDLVTDGGARSRGFGAAMLRWLARQAVASGLARVYLDSRAAARSFYEQLGFQMMTSIPCWMDAAALADVAVTADAGTPGGIVIAAAQECDLVAVLELLGRSGLPEEGLRAHLGTVLIARERGRVVGSAALELYGTAALLRSVAVDQTLRGRGLGGRLTEEAVALACRHGVRSLYLLTETARDFFAARGFVPVDREAVPAAVRASPEFAWICPASAVAMTRALP